MENTFKRTGPGRGSRLRPGLAFTTAVVVVVLSAVVPPSGVAAASAAASAKSPAGTWSSAQAVPGLASLSSSGADTTSASCPTPGNCTIVGWYAGSSGEEGFAVSEVDGSWRHAQAIPGLSSLGVNGAQFTSVSCAAAANCSAGGASLNVVGGGDAFVASEVDGTWAAQPVKFSSADSAGQSNVSSVSCALPGDCVAAGFAAGADFGGPPMVITQDKGKWGTARTLSLPSGSDLNSDIFSVSCTAVGYCTAVGSYQDVSNNWHAFVVTEAKGTWGSVEKVPSGLVQLASVSCASPGNCVAGGHAGSGTADNPYRPFVVTQSGGKWAAPVAVPGESGGQVTAVSCAGIGDCAAVGTSASASTSGGFAVSEENGKWGNPVTFSGTGLSSVSCAAAGTCSAGGQGSADPATVDEVDGTWGAPAILADSVPGAQILSVSCAAAGACAAAGGGYNSGTGQWQALVATEKNPVVGIYSDFTTTGNVKQAAGDGWDLLASVSGKSKGACTNTTTQGSTWGAVPTGADGAVEQVLSSRGRPYPGWISFWTPAVPSFVQDDKKDGEANLANLYAVGLAVGQKAANDVEKAASKVALPLNPVGPTYVALDFDTSDTGAGSNHQSVVSCGNNVTAASIKAGEKDAKTDDKQCWDWAGAKAQRNCWNVSAAGWKQFAEGWAAGVRSGTTPLRLSPAIYANASEYQANGLGSYGVRLADYIPVLGAAVFKGSRPMGPAIAGYIAFYGTCSSAAANIATVRSWGALVNTIQFGSSSTICGP